MNGLEKSIFKLINILVQFKVMIKRLELVFLLGEASNFKKVKKTRHWKKKESKSKGPPSASQPVLKALAIDKGKKKEVSKASKRENTCHCCREKRHWKKNCPRFLASVQGDG
ncbi:UNVERIFIED_CONTAM: hypothetical protein Sradi_6652900 [Sesamum radiatum]|uniref:CCHC-type domain-containing protein n=1 Tax=Sesamum radiatum TaxID=300843 RepID=A0AAW2JP44_SESRA